MGYGTVSTGFHFHGLHISDYTLRLLFLAATNVGDFSDFKIASIRSVLAKISHLF